MSQIQSTTKKYTYQMRLKSIFHFTQIYSSAIVKEPQKLEETENSEWKI